MLSTYHSQQVSVRRYLLSAVLHPVCCYERPTETSDWQANWVLRQLLRKQRVNFVAVGFIKAEFCGEEKWPV
jgi:hypothetical protein